MEYLYTAVNPSNLCFVPSLAVVPQKYRVFGFEVCVHCICMCRNVLNCGNVHVFVFLVSCPTSGWLHTTHRPTQPNTIQVIQVCKMKRRKMRRRKMWRCKMSRCNMWRRKMRRRKMWICKMRRRKKWICKMRRRKMWICKINRSLFLKNPTLRRSRKKGSAAPGRSPVDNFLIFFTSKIKYHNVCF